MVPLPSKSAWTPVIRAASELLAVDGGDVLDAVKVHVEGGEAVAKARDQAARQCLITGIGSSTLPVADGEGQMAGAGLAVAGLPTRLCMSTNM